ncbi:MAG TPA: dTDP-4-dehydrorhamnose reductase [Flavobacterium sp.]|jgi:dTDP-4-dehydrorhamnose reductase
MVVLVTGAAGQVGQALKSISSDYPEITFNFFSSADADVTDAVKLSEVFQQVKPDFCINAAAYTGVDKAETEIEKARLINVEGVKNVARACAAAGCTLIHISTDFVFDGTSSVPYREEDTTNPIGVYGQTKRDGEIALAQNHIHHFIIRTSWIYSSFGSNFMKTMLRLGTEKEQVSVVNDQTGTPTHAIDLAQALIKIIRSKSQNYGTYHFSNEGYTTWYGFAKEIFAAHQLPARLIPVPTTEFPTPARRPAYSVLDKTKIRKEFGLEIPDWREAYKKEA